LALWQAHLVQGLLAGGGCATQIVHIKSDGDTDLHTPLYELGVQGIFTKSLDIALLKGDIDLAVHSLKDVPTQMAAGLAIAAVLERGSYQDILVPKTDSSFLDAGIPAVIGTGSIRRKAQWLHRYPHHRIENLRGNVVTRLQKLADSDWNGAVFAAAGLERLGIRPEGAVDLGWMLPAPAQGAVVVVCRAGDTRVLDACRPLNHAPTALCTGIERAFLRALFGGCTTPISALATCAAGRIAFQGNVLSADGKHKSEVFYDVPEHDADDLGRRAAADVLSAGGKEILEGFQRDR
jgi:hydroxymethylbilane synthase